MLNFPDMLFVFLFHLCSSKHYYSGNSEIATKPVFHEDGKTEINVQYVNELFTL